MDDTQERMLQVLGAHAFELAAARMTIRRLEQELTDAPYFCDECKTLVFAVHRGQRHEAK